jgi:tryptophan synthase beta chain
MHMLGAQVVPVTAGSATLKDALNEAIRDWIANVEGTHYMIGTAAGPHPYPFFVRELQRVLGDEARAQMLERTGRLPDVAVACVGGGSNCIGLFHPFRDDPVRLVGVEAGGDGGDLHARSLGCGRSSILHGARSYVLCDEHGQVTETHSISAGLDYPGVGPELAQLKDEGRVEFVGESDDEALAAFHRLCRLEGIIPALESSHALARAERLARELGPEAIVLVGLSGRGDKDVDTVQERMEAGPR